MELRGRRWTLGKEHGSRRALAPWPLAGGGSTDARAHEHLDHGRAGSRPAAPQGRKRGGGGPGRGCGRHGDGEEAAGRPTGGSKTLAAVEMGRAASWRPRNVELWPGGAERGRRCRERSGRRRGTGKKLGSLTASGGRRERPTLTKFRPLSALAYIPRVICRGGSKDQPPL